MDLLLMKMGSRVLTLLPGIKWLSLPEIVEEFEKLMVQQVNSPSLNRKYHTTVFAVSSCLVNAEWMSIFLGHYG